MSVRAPVLRLAKAKAESGSGILYGWLLVALFIEYARPTKQLTWLEFPFFYSLVPMTLLFVSMFAQGLRPMKEIFADRMAKWILILFGIVFASFVFSGFSTYASSVLQSVLGYVFLFILIARLATTEERVKGIIVTLVIAHLYLLAMNFEVLTNPSERQYLTGGTFLGDGNDFSLSLCILFPCMVGVALGARSSFGRVLAWSSAAVITLAVVATQSRGGTLGVAAVMIYLWLRSSKKLASGIGIAMIGALVLIYAPPVYFDRMGTVSSMSIDGSAQGRLDAWGGAIGMGANNPVLGIGAGQFGARWGKTAHSTYLLALAELGIPGFAAVCMLVFGNLRENARRRTQLLTRVGPKPDEIMKRSMQLLDLMNAGMVGFAVAGAFLSATYYPHIYVLTALFISARILVARQASLQSAANL